MPAVSVLVPTLTMIRFLCVSTARDYIGAPDNISELNEIHKKGVRSELKRLTGVGQTCRLNELGSSSFCLAERWRVVNTSFIAPAL